MLTNNFYILFQEIIWPVWMVLDYSENQHGSSQDKHAVNITLII